MLKLILGRAGSGKTTKVLERLCRAGQERPQVLLVPEQQSHEAERALCRAGGDGVSLYAEVLSFSRLANRVISQAAAWGGGAGRRGPAAADVLRSAVRLAAAGGIRPPIRRPAFCSRCWPRWTN